MSREQASANGFLSFSAALTGFSEVDLQGTGLVEVYLEELFKRAGDDKAGELLSLWQTIESEQLDADRLHEKLLVYVMNEHTLGPVAANLIKMWYLGQWEADIVSPQAYTQGLVWTVMNAHPPGAKQEGFGSWALPPRGAAEPG